MRGTDPFWERPDKIVIYYLLGERVYGNRFVLSCIAKYSCDTIVIKKYKPSPSGYVVVCGVHAWGLSAWNDHMLICHPLRLVLGINLSLSALGRCIGSLTEGDKHIP